MQATPAQVPGLRASLQIPRAAAPCSNWWAGMAGAPPHGQRDFPRYAARPASMSLCLLVEFWSGAAVTAGCDIKRPRLTIAMTALAHGLGLRVTASVPAWP